MKNQLKVGNEADVISLASVLAMLFTVFSVIINGRSYSKMFLVRIYYGIAYFVVLIFEILKAELDVAVRTVNGRWNLPLF